MRIKESFLEFVTVKYNFLFSLILTQLTIAFTCLICDINLMNGLYLELGIWLLIMCITLLIGYGVFLGDISEHINPLKYIIKGFVFYVITFSNFLILSLLFIGKDLFLTSRYLGSVFLLTNIVLTCIVTSNELNDEDKKGFKKRKEYKW